ncbi:hypothetical protein NE236_19005 [Actinoallomurus purpureus]|uniref:hypothetical protein n=1 Tax=Actinoallomurus purpureus TaxID=478114 RepID=UPI0020923697|nr:hypothetical protein [Actinoallomurus purpureus]MCO6007075.1 hypothetical protein [Actinoallomurus purpureus]
MSYEVYGSIGEGPFRGIVVPCDTCLSHGDRVRLSASGVVWETCPDCSGSGHVHIRCAEDEVEEVMRRLPLTREQLQVRQALITAGLCVACYGAGVLASVDCTEDGKPVRYVEAPCPVCSA